MTHWKEKKLDIMLKLIWKILIINLSNKERGRTRIYTPAWCRYKNQKQNLNIYVFSLLRLLPIFFWRQSNLSNMLQ